MEILKQFEVILLSYFYAILFMILYEFFNRLFYSKKGKFIRLPFEIIFFLIMTLIYFVLLLKIYDGKFNIFIILFVILGIITYMMLLQIHVLRYYDYIFKKINNKLTHFKFKLKSKFAIIKMNYRKRKIEHEKNSRTKRTNKDKKRP